MEYDFSGWATRSNVLCSDGRTIMTNAFKHNDGQTVPLVWNHRHQDVGAVLGHALLKNRGDGVYAYCTFNDTEAGKTGKLLVQHGDVESLSIYANKLKQDGGNVIHGDIKEVSLVLAGANPGAFIDSVIKHGEDFSESEEAYIFNDSDRLVLYHSEDEEDDDEDMDDEKTVAEVFDTLTDEQKKVVYGLIGASLAQSDIQHSDEFDDEDEDYDYDEYDNYVDKDEDIEYAYDEYEEDDEDMKHNAFDYEEDYEEYEDGETLTHSELNDIVKNSTSFKSMKEAFLAHGAGDVTTSSGEATYGVDDINWLFPEAHNLDREPQFIQRDQGWVGKVMQGVHHTPFSRIKSVFADITADEARARGYLKGHLKKEEVFTLLKRATDPTTVYKKQKFDRDDLIDITDLDVVAWIKKEMRMMLNEEIARAVLIGDGRMAMAEDHIDDTRLRPVWKDAELFTIKARLTTPPEGKPEDRAQEFIKTVIKSRKNYKGSGEPTLFTTEDVITDCLLLEDKVGRPLYDSMEKLKTKLRVKDIVPVPVMENQSREDGGHHYDLMGIIVNLKDYNVGADKGGEVNMFDDFDIDYNQYKYLIETRISGALVKPYSAIVVEAPKASLEDASAKAQSAQTPSHNE